MKTGGMILLLVLASITFISCQPGGGSEAGPTEISNNSTNVTTELPGNFRMYDAAGKVITLESLKGKKLFVNLWATWCPPCKKELPSIERLYQSLDTAKVAFVMLALDDQFEKAKKYLSSRKSTLPVFYPAEDLPALFRVEYIPTTFIFDDTGKIIHRVDGSDDYDTEKFRSLLQ